MWAASSILRSSVFAAGVFPLAGSGVPAAGRWCRDTKYDQAVFLCIGRSRMLFVPRINEFSFDCTKRDSTFQRIPEDMIELNDVLHAGYCFRLIDDSMFHILKLRRLTCVVILTAAAFLFFFFLWQIGRWGSHLVVFVFYSKAQVTNSIVCVPAADAVCRYKRQLLQEQ